MLKDYKFPCKLFIVDNIFSRNQFIPFSIFFSSPSLGLKVCLPLHKISGKEREFKN